MGYSDVLNFYLRLEEGELVFIDPANDAPTLTYEDRQAKAEQAETIANNEIALRQQETAIADNEAALCQQAEERARQLGEELWKLRGK